MPPVEQDDAGDRHQQHEHRADQHPRGVGAVDRRGLGRHGCIGGRSGLGGQPLAPPRWSTGAVACGGGGWLRDAGAAPSGAAVCARCRACAAATTPWPARRRMRCAPEFLLLPSPLAPRRLLLMRRHSFADTLPHRGRSWHGPRTKRCPLLTRDGLGAMAAPKPCITRLRAAACGESTARRSTPAAQNPNSAVACALSNP